MKKIVLVFTLLIFTFAVNANDAPRLEYFTPGEYYLIEGGAPCSDEYVGPMLDDTTGQIDFMLGQHIIFANITNMPIDNKLSQSNSIKEGNVVRIDNSLQRKTLIDAETEIKRIESITFQPNRIDYHLKMYRDNMIFNDVICWYERMETSGISHGNH